MLFAVLEPPRAGTVPLKWDSRKANLRFGLAGRCPLKGNGVAGKGSRSSKELCLQRTKPKKRQLVYIWRLAVSSWQLAISY